MDYTEGEIKGLLQMIMKIIYFDDQIAAFIEENGNVYYTTWSRKNKEPFSATTLLVTVLHDLIKPAPSNPKIYVLHQPSEMDKGYAALFNSAKVKDVSQANEEDAGFGFLQNVTPLSTERYRKELDAFTLISPKVINPALNVNMTNTLVGRLYMMAIYAQLTGTFALDPIGNAIGALLVSANGHILAWSINTAEINNTCHAETNLIQSFFKDHAPYRSRGLPKGSTLFTTLKPCKMCAGLILDSAEDPAQLRVVYNQHDDTTLAGTTVLDTFTTSTGLRIQSLLSAIPTLAHMPSQERTNWKSAGPRYQGIPVLPVSGLNPSQHSPNYGQQDMSFDLEFAFKHRPPIQKTITTRYGVTQQVTQPPQMTEWLQSIPLKQWIRKVSKELQYLQRELGYDHGDSSRIADQDVRNALKIIDDFLHMPKALQ